MRIGILSDTHDELALTAAAIATLQREGAQRIVHCGDLTTPPIVHACGVLPSFFVFGNHDADNVPALEAAIVEAGAVCLGSGGIMEVAGLRIAITHGHTGMRDLLAEEPDYLLHGHSHLVADERLGPIRRICPGALHRVTTPTVALLDTATRQLKFFVVHA